MSTSTEKAEPEPDYKAAKEWADRHKDAAWEAGCFSIMNVSRAYLALSARVEQLENALVEWIKDLKEYDLDGKVEPSTPADVLLAHARAILAQRSKTP